MQTLDEMRSLRLITDDQHARISDWIATARTPEAILQMPQELWRPFALASVLMDFDADLAQPPLFEHAPAAAMSGSGSGTAAPPAG